MSVLNTANGITSRRPRNSSFQQQVMIGWSPNFHAKPTSRFFFCSGIIFIIVAIFLFIVQMQIDEFSIDYTLCKNIHGKYCGNMISGILNISSPIICTCSISLELLYAMKAPVYFYYQLNNYYQNHRRIYNSRDDDQLKGKNILQLDSDCKPLMYADTNKRSKYAPCGLMANALFNDSFQFSFKKGNYVYTVPWSNKNIAWRIDRFYKFGIPKTWEGTVKPPSWNFTPVQRNKNAYSGDEEFLVWMRSAALPSVKKLHRIILKNTYPFENGLPKGNYILNINYAYPVTIFNGSKSIFITTTGLFGGKNSSICYLFVGVAFIHLAIGVILIILNQYSITRVKKVEFDFDNDEPAAVIIKGH